MSRKIVQLLLLTIAASIPSAPAALASGTRVFNREGVIGATTGGIAGGLIGNQSGDTFEGAAIGAVIGYAIGANIHRQKRRDRAIEERQQHLEHLLRMEQDRTADAEAAALEAARNTPPSPPPLTREQKQQLMLQATPLFTVRRP